jgi:hypothetical protein
MTDAHADPSSSDSSLSSECDLNNPCGVQQGMGRNLQATGQNDSSGFCVGFERKRRASRASSVWTQRSGGFACGDAMGG